MLDALSALRQRLLAPTHHEALPGTPASAGSPVLLQMRNAPLQLAAATGSAPPPDPLARHAIPDEQAQILAGLLVLSRRALDPAYALCLNEPETAALNLFYRTRTDLLTAVRAMPVSAPLHGCTTPSLDACPHTAAILRRLLADSPGLVVAEANGGRAAKDLLIYNMAVLRALGVDTIYIDQFQSELHQGDLDALHRTGRQMPLLRRFVQGIDAGHMTDVQGGHSYAAVLDAASRAGLRVVALDLMSSYHLKGAGDDEEHRRESEVELRTRVFSHVAAQRISHDQCLRQARAGSRRWVALLSNAYAGSFNGIAGVGPRLGVPSLRVEDADAHENDALRVGFDPGRSIPPGPLTNAGEMQCDYLLKVPLVGHGALRSTPEPCSATQAQAARVLRAAIAGCAADLARIGTYRLVELASGEQVLVHRSSTHELVAQRIVTTPAGGLRLQLAEEAHPDNWSHLDREFPDLNHLRQALDRRMEEVPRSTPV